MCKPPEWCRIEASHRRLYKCSSCPCPGRDDDGQAVLFAQAVAGPAYLMVAALVGMVVLVVGKADRIENQMVVNMPLIDMVVSTNSYLPPNISFANCIPISWASSAETSPGSKAWIRWRPKCVPCRWHDGVSIQIQCRRFQQHNPKEDTSRVSICLFGIADIVNGRFQR